jgi:hypothetical protein
MNNNEIKHKYKKYKQYSKILFREIQEQMEAKNPNIGLLAKLNGDLEKCVIVMRVYLSLINEL